MRIYDGCPDSELKKRMDNDRRLLLKFAKAGLTVTYFPFEGAWMAFDKNYKSASGFYESIAALAKGILK